MTHARTALFNSSHRDAALGALFSGLVGLNGNPGSLSVKVSLGVGQTLTWIALSTIAVN